MARSPSTDADEPAGFDVREYARTAHGSLRHDLDVTSIAAAPLPADVLGVLGVLAVLEAATMPHLRNVLVTHTHKDARVTAFLVTWAFEKYWIADALRAIVDAGSGASSAGAGGGLGAAPGLDAAQRAGDPGRFRWRTGTRSGSRVRGPVRRAVAGFTQGWDVVGAHLAVGLVDDLVLGAVYDRVLVGTPHAALHAALGQITAVKARHTRFFDEEVRRRLSASDRATRLARRELRRMPWPLGSAALTEAERAGFSEYAFGGAHGAALAAELGQEIGGLPGIGPAAASAVSNRLAPPPRRRRDATT
jgi:hypothetical protein